MSSWSNGIRKFCIIATSLLVSIALSGASSPLSAQEQQQPQPQALTQQQLAQLVAPIALYPDSLLAQVLTASTYPLEVVMAARWSETNPNLKGPALEDAMQRQPWDPSVKGLTSVPQVLAMMNEKLDWTNQLGEAFLAQPDDVQNAIQALRAQAEAAGNLKSSREQRVRRVAATPRPDYVGPPEYIVIEPLEPEYVYVPVYDPVVVYGVGYWEPAYQPFFWYPAWWAVGPAYGFGPAFFVGPALWYQYNWGYGGFAAIQVNTALYSKFNKTKFGGGGQFQTWKFNPAHHGNVPFKNPKLQQQYGNLGGKGGQGFKGGVQGGQGFKGVQGGQGFKGGQGLKGVHGGQGGQGFKGVQGGQGGQGLKGVQGGQGGQGIKGVHGAPGGQGFKGVQGGPGGQGFKGAQDGQGGQGFKGVHSQGGQGFKGVQGGQGGQGFKGVQGGQGGQGFKGVQGGQGGQGFKGVQGGQGGQGFKAVQGAQGGQGFKAIQGNQGGGQGGKNRKDH